MASSRTWFDQWRNSRTRENEALDLDRVELADVTGGPAAMAAAVHNQLGPLSAAVPIDEVATSLDITEIRRDRFDGFEGMLLTDRMRSYGKILVNTRGGAQRARFSVAHELGHFLLENHELTGETGFVCNAQDMSERHVATRHQRQETEANRFAIELLAPAYRLAPYLTGDPDLATVRVVNKEMDISLEAAVRRYVELHEEPLAAVLTRQQVVRYVVWNDRFPRMRLEPRNTLSSATRAHRVITAGKTGLSRLVETHAVAWLRDPDIELFEQTRLGTDGFATTLLWASRPESDVDKDGVAELSTPTFQKRRPR